MVRAVWFTVAALLVVALSPAGAATHAAEFVRIYEFSGTASTGPEGAHLSAYRCMGGQDTPADGGACVGYFVGPVDFRGHLLVVRVNDDVSGGNVWLTVVVDLDGDLRTDCAVDICVQGKGSVSTLVPEDAAGRYVQAFPTALYSTGPVCCPDGDVGTRGAITFSFSPVV